MGQVSVHPHRMAGGWTKCTIESLARSDYSAPSLLAVDTFYHTTANNEGALHICMHEESHFTPFFSQIPSQNCKLARESPQMQNLGLLFRTVNKRKS